MNAIDGRDNITLSIGFRYLRLMPVIGRAYFWANDDEYAVAYINDSNVNFIVDLALPYKQGNAFMGKDDEFFQARRKFIHDKWCPPPPEKKL